MLVCLYATQNHSYAYEYFYNAICTKNIDCVYNIFWPQALYLKYIDIGIYSGSYSFEP